MMHYFETNSGRIYRFAEDGLNWYQARNDHGKVGDFGTFSQALKALADSLDSPNQSR